MRKPRDYDSELQVLNDKAKHLKDRKLHQLGELVIATGADALPVEELAGVLLGAVGTTEATTKEGWWKRGAASFNARTALAAALARTRAALKRLTTARNRVSARMARDENREWVVKRRERTRQLIELGGLVAKANLVELTGDDRAVIFGVLAEAASALRNERREQALALWRRRGKRAFEDASAS